MRKGYVKDLSALLAGALLPLAFAPVHWDYLAIPCLMILFSVLKNASPMRAAMRAFLFGLGPFGVGVSSKLP